MIERIRGVLPWNTVEEANGKLSDREILNVFRYAENTEETMLKTAEVAEELPISPEWTHERLERLEDDGRVQSRTFAGVDVWRLSPSETSTPIPASAGDLGWWRYQARESAFIAYRWGMTLLMVGGLLLIPAFFLYSTDQVNRLIFHQNMYGAAAMAAALVAGLAFVGGSITHLSAIAIQRYLRQNAD